MLRLSGDGAYSIQMRHGEEGTGRLDYSATQITVSLSGSAEHEARYAAAVSARVQAKLEKYPVGGRRANTFTTTDCSASQVLS